MKSILKNRFFYAFLCFAAACVFVFAGLSFTAKGADADSGNTTSGIVFEQGASVRIDTKGDTSGIRFTAKLGADVYNAVTEEVDGVLSIKDNAELGMIIVPQSYIDAYEQKSNGRDYFTFFSQNGVAKENISTQFKASQILFENGEYYVRGALVSIYPQNYERVFRAVAYYAVGGTYYYFLHADGRSVEEVSVKAIQAEQAGEKSYEDAQLDVLHTYANGEVARVIYDAKNTNHFPTYDESGNLLTEGKFKKVESLTDVGKEHDFKLEQSSVNGEACFKITVLDPGQVDTNGTGAISVDWVMDNINEDWVDVYNHVGFDIWMGSSRSGIQCSITDDDLACPFGESGWVSVSASKAHIDVLPTELQGGQSNFHMSVTGVKKGDIIYLSSFIAHSIKSIQNEINALPTEGYITTAQKLAANRARLAYDSIRGGDAIKAEVDTERLVSCENLPIKIYDMTDEAVLANFTKENLTAKGQSWEGDLTLENGWLKVSLSTSVTPDENGDTSAAFSYKCPTLFDRDEDDGYVVAFQLMLSREGVRSGMVTCYDNGEEGQWYTATYNNQVFNDVWFDDALFDKCANGACYLTSKNVQVGDYCYLGDFIAHNKGSLENLINSIPLDGEYTEENKKALDEAVRFAGTAGLNGRISDEAKERLNLLVAKYNLADIPTEGILTVAEKKNLTAARDAYDFLSDENKALVEKAERLAMAALDVDTEEGLSRFDYPDTWIDGSGAERTNGKGEVQQIQDLSGASWYKFTATDGAGLTYFNFRLADVDFTGYEDGGYASFILATDAKVDKQVKFHSWGNWQGVDDYKSADELPSKKLYMCTIDIDSLKGMASVPALVEGLQKGESFYMTDIVAHNANSVQDRLDALKTEGYLSALEERELRMLEQIRDTNKSYESFDLDWSNLEEARKLPMLAVDNKETLSTARLTVDERNTGLSRETDAQGKVWQKLTALDDGAITFTWDLSAIDFQQYQNGCVTYQLKTDSDTPDSVGIASVLAPGEIQPLDGGIKTIALSWEDFEKMFDPESVRTMGAIVTGLKKGESFYISDMICFNTESVRYMASTLPTEGILSVEDKQNLTLVTKLNAALDEPLDLSEPLGKASLLPMRAIEVSEENVENMWANVEINDPENAGATGGKGEMTRVYEDGRWWFKFTLLEKGTSDYVAFSVDLGDIDYSGYDWFLYTVRTDSKETIYFTQGTANPFKPSLDADGRGSEIQPNVDRRDFAPAYALDALRFEGHSLLIEGLEEGESFYITEFIGFSVEVMQSLINNLPDPETVTEEDREKIKQVRAYYDHSEYKGCVQDVNVTDTNLEGKNTYVNTLRLVACEEKLKNGGSAV